MRLTLHERPDGTLTLVDEDGDTTARFTGEKADYLCGHLLESLTRNDPFLTVYTSNGVALVDNVGAMT